MLFFLSIFRHLLSDVHTVSNMPIMKSRQSPVLQDVGEVTDGDINTCVTIAANDMATIMVPITDAQNDSVTVKILSKHDSLCSHYNDKDIFTVVKVVPPFRTSIEGLFTKCGFGPKYDEATLSVQLFECTCTYGPCEDFYVKIHSLCSVSLCSIEVF